MKTKALSTLGRGNSTANVLDRVEILPPAPQTEQEKFWHLVGRHEAFSFNAAFATAAWAANVERIHESKLYLREERDWDTWCRKRTPYGRNKVDELRKDWRDFGKWGFAAQEMLQVNRTTLRALNASFSEDGEIVVGNEKYSLKTKAGINSAQVAIAAIQEQKRKAEQAAAEADREKETIKKERDNAKKAAEREHQALLDHKKAQAERFPNADDDYKAMLDAQSHLDLAMAKLATVGNRELSTENQARYIGCCEYAYRALIQATFDARQKFGKGWNMADPTDMLSLDQVAPNARNLMSEYVDQNRK